MMIGRIELPKMKGVEIRPGITCLEEPTPVEGTNKLRVLCDVRGYLAIVELKVTFVPETEGET